LEYGYIHVATSINGAAKGITLRDEKNLIGGLPTEFVEYKFDRPYCTEYNHTHYRNSSISSLASGANDVYSFGHNLKRPPRGISIIELNSGAFAAFIQADDTNITWKMQKLDGTFVSGAKQFHISYSM
jgi:hypothetical protein